jgi:hypothetical protein
MAKTTQQRSKKSADKAKAAGEEDLRHKLRPGTSALLADLMHWHGITVISEAIQNMILNLHALGPEGSADALKSPRHKIEVSENVARTLYMQGALKAARMDAEG